MVEFNPDGSIKLPGSVQRAKDDNENKMRSQRCIRVQKRILSFDAPKKCCLKISLSPLVSDPSFVQVIFNELKYSAETPLSLTRVDDKNFEVFVGSDFRRCSDCSRLINCFREMIQVVEERGNCSYSPFGFME